MFLSIGEMTQEDEFHPENVACEMFSAVGNMTLSNISVAGNIF